MASNREKRQEEIRFKVMRLVDQKSSITTREIARIIGISNGSAYYCISALVEKGFVKLNNFASSSQKSNYIYKLTRRGVREKAILTAEFLENKREEYLMVKKEIEKLETELKLDNLQNLYREKDKDGQKVET